MLLVSFPLAPPFLELAAWQQHFLNTVTHWIFETVSSQVVVNNLKNKALLTLVEREQRLAVRLTDLRWLLPVPGQRPEAPPLAGTARQH